MYSSSNDEVFRRSHGQDNQNECSKRPIGTMDDTVLDRAQQEVWTGYSCT